MRGTCDAIRDNWIRAASANTKAAIPSTIATALGTTQGS